MVLFRAIAGLLGLLALHCAVRAEGKCSVGSMHENSLPAGGESVDSLRILSKDLETCLSSCCALGPHECQFLWVLEGTCIVVACDRGNWANCEPKQSPIATKSSFYISVNRPSHHLEDIFKWALNGITDPPQVTLAPTTPPQEGDSPPVAATPTDEIYVTLPTNEVTIYGNYSKDDKAIVSYSWKLLSKHFVRPILKNADEAILHVSNLAPGTYHFSLSVTDSRGQSARTSVIVHVDEGPTQAINTHSSTLPTAAVTTKTGAPPSNHTLDNSLDPGLNDTGTVDEQDVDPRFTKRRNILKIVIPVLVSVSMLLIVSAAITILCACCLERNKSRMKRYYKYKRLSETLEKT